MHQKNLVIIGRLTTAPLGRRSYPHAPENFLKRLMPVYHLPDTAKHRLKRDRVLTYLSTLANPIFAHLFSWESYKKAFMPSSPLLRDDGHLVTTPLKVLSCWGRTSRDGTVNHATDYNPYRALVGAVAYNMMQFMHKKKREFDILNIHVWIGKPHALDFMHVSNGKYLAKDGGYKLEPDEAHDERIARLITIDEGFDPKSAVATTALLLDQLPRHSLVTILVNGISGFSLTSLLWSLSGYP